VSDRYSFLIPLLLGMALVGASAFTTAYSRLWGERGGQRVTSALRNLLGIPLGLAGFVFAWVQPAQSLFIAGMTIKTLGWLLVLAGSIPFLWGHAVMGRRTGWPSLRDSLERRSLYAHVRHPIYAGSILVFIGLALLKPTSPVVLACGVGIVWLYVQALLEEIDLVQRLPEYRDYVKQVPRFLPRLGRTRPSIGAEP
jgi:protein-S-isoprenylcysteine O-methyltransferase Ste14